MSESTAPALTTAGRAQRDSVFVGLEAVSWPELELAAVDVAIANAAIAEPVRGSFGAQTSRVSVLVRVRDSSGVSGYGEIWANFPEGGARYKAELVRRYAAPLLMGRVVRQPWAVWDLLDAQLVRLALQSGDFGAFAQVCAGIDQAVWDLYCHRLGAPLWKLAGGTRHVAVYASGIGPERVAVTIRQQADAGHTRFKIKLGFGDTIDRRNLEAALDALPAGGVLLADANQAWEIDSASEWLTALEQAGLGWCEEPVRADLSLDAWAALTDPLVRLRVAAGENARGLDDLSALASSGGLRVIQPDVGKWGGVTGALRLRSRLEPDVWLCPHWLAGAVGLAASLQVSGALREPGPVEIDVNPNALRTELLDTRLTVDAGAIHLGDRPGIVPGILRHTLDWG